MKQWHSLINELPTTVLPTGVSHKRRAVPRRCKADVENWKLTSQFAPMQYYFKGWAHTEKAETSYENSYFGPLSKTGRSSGDGGLPFPLSSSAWACLVPNAMVSHFLLFSSSWVSVAIYHCVCAPVFPIVETYLSVPIRCGWTMATNSLSFLPSKSEANIPSSWIRAGLWLTLSNRMW